jgi:transcriptional regulator with XRE-family HTH domain
VSGPLGGDGNRGGAYPPRVARGRLPRWTGGGPSGHSGKVDESQRWVEFGRWLVEQRERLGLRRRDAAKRAKIPETVWRDLETGRKDSVGGVRLLPTVSAEVLDRVASALEVSQEEVLKRVGRPPVRVDGSAQDVSERLNLSQKIARLSYRDRRILERLVDAMLEED